MSKRESRASTGRFGGKPVGRKGGSASCSASSSPRPSSPSSVTGDRPPKKLVPLKVEVAKDVFDEDREWTGNMSGSGGPDSARQSPRAMSEGSKQSPRIITEPLACSPRLLSPTSEVIPGSFQRHSQSPSGADLSHSVHSGHTPVHNQLNASLMVARRGSGLGARTNTIHSILSGGEDDEEGDPFRTTVAPCAPLGQLQRQGTSVYQRNTVDNIDDVRMRRASMNALKQQETEQKAKEADAKREQAKFDKFDRPKREHLAQRTLLWLQVLCTVTVPKSVTQGAAETRAKYLLTLLWLPMVNRYRKLRAKRMEKRNYIKSCEAAMQDLKLEPADLQKIEFFADWRPYNLEKLIEAMQPDAFREGEYIMMEGDWGMEMYVIAKGKIDIAIRKAGQPGGPKKKSRSRKDGIVVASLDENSGKRYFGEFSILCHEPRTASVIAATDIMLWRIGKKDIDEQLDLLPSTVREKVLAHADNRRTQNMAKLFPLRCEKLTKAPEGACPLFQCYAVPPTQLQEIVNLFEPRVVRANTVLFEQGDPGDLFYFIASGEVTIRKKKKGPSQTQAPSAFPKRQQSIGQDGTQGKGVISPRGVPQEERRESQHAGQGAAEDDDDDPYETVAVLGQGHSFGEVALIFLETRTARAVATQTSDLWVLKKDDLLMFLMSMPDWFVEAKRTMSNVRASWLPPLAAELWQKDATLNKLFGAKFFKEITNAAEPRVLDRSMDLVTSGADVDSLFVVTEGSVRVMRTNEVIKAPAVFGVPDVLTFQPRWFTSYKAERRCDLYQITKTDFWAAARRYNSEALQKIITKEFQDAVSEEYHMPFQPWEDKLSEHARVASSRRSLAADGDRASPRAKSPRSGGGVSPTSFSRQAVAKRQSSSSPRVDTNGRPASPRSASGDGRGVGLPRSPNKNRTAAAGGAGRGVSAASAARGNA